MKWFPKEVSAELRPYIKSIEEEKANWLSHAVGIVVFGLAVPVLIYKSKDFAQAWPCAVFGISLLMVYVSSTVYHSLFQLETKLKARVIDHICIYFLIAGSFTPFVLLKLPTDRALTLLKVIWLLVGLGMVFKFFFTNKFRLASTMAYTGMGLLALFIIEPLGRVLPPLSMRWLSIGGLSYVLGVPFYLWKALKYNHLYWHMAVLVGSISHFLAVWYMV
jgi:hemolysin III